MKKIIVWSILIVFVALLSLIPTSSVEAKNKGLYSQRSYTSINYKYGGRLKWQKPYYSPKRGGWTEGHFKTWPDQYKWNNRKNIYGF